MFGGLFILDPDRTLSGSLVLLLLRRRCMEETSGIEDGLAASSFYTAGFLHCVALLGSSRTYVSLLLPVAPRSIQV